MIRSGEPAMRDPRERLMPVRPAVPLILSLGPHPRAIRRAGEARHQTYSWSADVACWALGIPR